MTTINRAIWIDDDGSGATGTIINNARLQGDVYDRIDTALATLDAKDASQDALITGNGPHKILSSQHTDSAAATLVTGDLLAADATGKLARLPAAANGSLLGVTAGLPAWVPQVQFTPIPYSAGIFTAFGTMTWTVEAADVNQLSYALIGKVCILTLNLGATTLAGTATGEMYIALPAAITPQTTMNALGRYYAAAAFALLFGYVVAGTARIALNPFAGGNFTLGTNDRTFQLTLIYGI